MLHPVKMDKKLKSKGFSIIVADSQNTSEEKIKGILDEHKVEFTVSRQIKSPIQSRGIPHSFVFDVEGQLIIQGHPMGFESTPDFIGPADEEGELGGSKKG